MAVSDKIRFGLNESFPIGSVFFTSMNKNPNTLLGYGTWQLIGSGRTILGADNDDTGKETGGSMSKALSVNNLPAHTHSIPSHTHTASSNTVSHNHDIEITNEGSTHSHYVVKWAQGTNNNYSGGKLMSAFENGQSLNNNSTSWTNIGGAHVHGASSSQESHSHNITVNSGGSGNTGSVGSSSPLDITLSYIKLFIWERTK